MAKAAGLEDVYLLHYSLLSGPIHSTVGDLDRQFRTNPTTGHLELLTEPEIENLNDELELLSAVMAGLAAPMDKVFHLGLEGICDAHHAAIIDLNRSDG